MGFMIACLSRAGPCLSASGSVQTIIDNQGHFLSKGDFYFREALKKKTTFCDKGHTPEGWVGLETDLSQTRSERICKFVSSLLNCPYILQF